MYGYLLNNDKQIKRDEVVKFARMEKTTIEAFYLNMEALRQRPSMIAQLCRQKLNYRQHHFISLTQKCEKPFYISHIA